MEFTLLEDVISAPSLNTIKSRLNKWWKDHPRKFVAAYFSTVSTSTRMNPGRFGPIPVRSGRFGPISGVSRFGPVGAGRFGPISLVGRFGPLFRPDLSIWGKQVR